MSENKRISDDDVVHSIENMLASESNPETRMRLLVLYRISVLLVDTIHITQLTKAELKTLQAEVTAHNKEQEQTSNRLLGGAKVVATVFLIVQGVFGYVATNLLEQHQSNTIQIHRLVDKVEKLETKVYTIDQKNTPNHLYPRPDLK